MKNILLIIAIFLLTIVSPRIVNGLSLIPGGENIAFEIYPDGLIVTGSYDVNLNGSIYNPSRDSDIVKGDKIIKIGDYKVINLKTFISHFSEFNDKCEITISRKGNILKRNLYLIRGNNALKTGLYVKERVLGVGTVSFYDPINKTYGALAHEVYDRDIEEIIDVRCGNIYLESVDSITKSSNGSVGSKNCTLTFDDKIGDIKKNTSFGIFGSIEEIPSSYQQIEVAKWDEVSLGKAYIRTCIKDNKVDEFSIEITSLKKQEQCDIKGISFKLTDETLLNKAGGIYQGMSGSPIIQNNKLIGAVTHVNIDNVSTGYAVYMQYMYQVSLQN